METTESIACYNDLCRNAIFDPVSRRKLEAAGCRCTYMLTSGIESQIRNKGVMLLQVAFFKRFDENNDPWEEHDCFFFTHEGHEICVKFDYYNSNLECGSEDPSDLSKTVRILTVMLASER